MRQIEFLNKLLATFQVVASNTKGRHWLVSGMNFRSIHLELDSAYEILRKGADQIAETIRVIGGIPIHTLQGFVDASAVREEEVVGDSLSVVEDEIRELDIITGMIQGAVDAKILDATTENDLAAISSEIRHQLLFFDGMSQNWGSPEPIAPAS